ncbi:hypothetical protein FAVG1_08490 [Fusarium avenaceum]|nr:hypothetical protein FAVG1_08490 [Fusarium avenaceum]
MAELALGLLGVVPLTTLAFKTSRSVHSKLKSFKHYSNEVSEVNNVFLLEQNRFKREYEILLRLVADEKTAKAITREANQVDDNTTDTQRVDEELREALGSGYDDWLELSKDINKVLVELATQLECFNILTREKKEVQFHSYFLQQLPFLTGGFLLTHVSSKEERLSDAVRRLKRRVQVPFSKKTFDDIVDRLCRLNDSLSTLREQLQRLQQPPRPSKHQRRHQIRGDRGAVCKQRRACNGLHHGLQQVWSCDKAKHTNHDIKIFLNMDQGNGRKNGKQPQDTVHLEIAVVGADVEQEEDATSTVTHLQIRSEWIERLGSVSSSAPSRDDVQLNKPTKRQKRHCFAGQTDKSLPLIPSSSPQAAVTGVSSSDMNTSFHLSFDLRTHVDLCYDLCSGSNKAACTGYIGFLDVSNDQCRRYHFHSSSFAQDQDWKINGAFPLNILFDDNGLDFASFIDRLKMARAIAIAALTYNSTPWLSECWRLGNLSFLAQGYDIQSALRSLHLGVELKSKNVLMQGLSTPESFRLSQSTEDERTLHGIKNISLYSLGVALLGIDKWRDLDLDDVLQVRKAAQSSSFGDRYRNIVRKCLGCEFRNETDLAQSRLHRAVYEEVVGSLESMIASLELQDDDDDDDDDRFS